MSNYPKGIICKNYINGLVDGLEQFINMVYPSNKQQTVEPDLYKFSLEC
ncbi:hypothetical protein [Lysinibacillus endophyticus]